MNTEDSILRYLMRKELTLRKVDFKENATFRIGRKNYTLDYYIKPYRIGIVMLDWKRSVHTNKLQHLERMLNAMKLHKLILLCNSISGNAKDFLLSRNIPIQVVYISDFLQKQGDIKDLISFFKPSDNIAK